LINWFINMFIKLGLQIFKGIIGKLQFFDYRFFLIFKRFDPAVVFVFLIRPLFFKDLKFHFLQFEHFNFFFYILRQFFRLSSWILGEAFRHSLN
jgi:hypothetical protein